jgi:hypothetical protein
MEKKVEAQFYRPPSAGNLRQLLPRSFTTVHPHSSGRSSGPYLLAIGSRGRVAVGRDARSPHLQICNARFEEQPRFPDTCVCTAHRPCMSPAPTTPFWSARGCCRRRAEQDSQGAR